jgi:hypothetical protein
MNKLIQQILDAPLGTFRLGKRVMDGEIVDQSKDEVVILIEGFTDPFTGKPMLCTARVPRNNESLAVFGR